MRPLDLALVASLGLCAFVTASPGRGEGQSTFALNVDLVVFNVAVMDGHGRPVPGLTAADFRVVEDHRAQAITLFSADAAPASVGLLIDNSGSMRPKHVDVTTAALAFLAASHPADELFVVFFNERVSMGLPPGVAFTHDLQQIRSALLGAAPDGLTALYDALALGLDHIRTGTQDRKTLVVLSDGRDNASHHRLDEVLTMAQESSAMIYTIGIYDEADRDQNPGVLRKIARASGGQAYFPEHLNDLEHAWREVAAGIRSQYTIGYNATNHRRDGLFRSVTITAGRTNGRGLTVRTRPGYRVPVEKSEPVGQYVGRTALQSATVTRTEVRSALRTAALRTARHAVVAK